MVGHFIDSDGPRIAIAAIQWTNDEVSAGRWDFTIRRISIMQMRTIQTDSFWVSFLYYQFLNPSLINNIFFHTSRFILIRELSWKWYSAYSVHWTTFYIPICVQCTCITCLKNSNHLPCKYAINTKEPF